jgi:hypothetical protein
LLPKEILGWQTQYTGLWTLMESIPLKFIEVLLRNENNLISKQCREAAKACLKYGSHNNYQFINNISRSVSSKMPEVRTNLERWHRLNYVLKGPWVKAKSAFAGSIYSHLISISKKDESLFSSSEFQMETYDNPEPLRFKDVWDSLEIPDSMDLTNYINDLDGLIRLSRGPSSILSSSYLKNRNKSRISKWSISSLSQQLIAVKAWKKSRRSTF